MSSWECPHCGAEHFDGDYPDHFSDLGPDNTFEFECDCGAVFDCHVEYEPYITSQTKTLKLPAEGSNSTSLNKTEATSE